MNVASQLQNRKRKKIDSYLDLFDKTILPVCTYNCELCYGMFLFSALNAHPMINYLPTLALATYQRSNTIARINQYLASQLSFLKHDIFLVYILFIDLFNYLFIFSKNKKINRIYQYDQFYRSCKILKKKGVYTIKRGNFDRSGSFVKLAMVPIQESLFVAIALMEINE